VISLLPTWRPVHSVHSAPSQPMDTHWSANVSPIASPVSRNQVLPISTETTSTVAPQRLPLPPTNEYKTDRSHEFRNLQESSKRFSQVGSPLASRQVLPTPSPTRISTFVPERQPAPQRPSPTGSRANEIKDLQDFPIDLCLHFPDFRDDYMNVAPSPPAEREETMTRSNVDNT